MSRTHDHPPGPPAAVPLGPFDLLRLQGAESMDLLQRITTNDLRGLAPGQVRSTVFTTEKGRIVDYVRVLAADEGAYLIASCGAGPELHSWIERFIIMEDIRATECTAGAGLHAWAGEGAGAVLRTGTAVSPGTWSRLPEEPALVCTTAEFGTTWLFAPGPPTTTPHASRPGDATELFRVLRGIPSRGRELREAFNPYDIGLTHVVSTTKGCYIGQEVIARIETYQKVRRRLMGVRFAGLLDPAAAGAVVLRDGADAGVLTTVAPAGGTTLALAVLRKDVEEGDRVTISGGGAERDGSVFALPAPAGAFA